MSPVSPVSPVKPVSPVSQMIQVSLAHLLVDFRVINFEEIPSTEIPLK